MRNLNVARYATIVFFGAYALAYLAVPLCGLIAAIAAGVACIAHITES